MLPFLTFFACARIVQAKQLDALNLRQRQSSWGRNLGVDQSEANVQGRRPKKSCHGKLLQESKKLGRAMLNFIEIGHLRQSEGCKDPAPGPLHEAEASQDSAPCAQTIANSWHWPTHIGERHKLRSDEEQDH